MFGFCCGLGGFYDGPSQLALPSCSCFCVEACCSTSLPSRSWYGPVLWQKWSELTHENSADIFKQFDYNSNGELEASELRNFLKAAFPRTELSKEELSELVTQFDSDQNGTIGLNELRAFLRCYNPESKTIQRKTALLVIDVQNDFISGSLAVQNSETIVKVINQIRDKFDCVVISYDWHPQDHCSFVESANDGKDMSVYKGQKANIDSYSAFFDNCKANDTGLTKQLEDAGVTDVYCCGLVFDICVKSSALHGAENGFRVSVIEDACKPLNETEVEGTRKLLANAGVQVMSSAEATREVSVQMSGSMPLKEFLQSVSAIRCESYEDRGLSPANRRNPHEPLVEITDLSLQHGEGEYQHAPAQTLGRFTQKGWSPQLLNATDLYASSGKYTGRLGMYMSVARSHGRKYRGVALLHSAATPFGLQRDERWTSTSPASCEYCTKEDDCTSGMERHLADCVRTGDLKRMEEELEDEEKDLEPWEDSEVFEAWGHKGAQLHDSDAEDGVSASDHPEPNLFATHVFSDDREVIHCVPRTTGDLDSFGRQEPKMCVTVKVTVPALTMRDESTRLIEAKLNTTLQVIANATQKADANASASGKSRRQAVAEVQAEANASYNATAYAEATYTAYAEATDRATATYKAVATAEAKEKTKVGATDVTAAARRNGTGAATKIANATRSVKAKGEAGVLVKLNQSGHGKASAEAEEKATVHLEDVERVTKNATVTVEGHGGLKKVFQATATAKAIVEAKACISARQARKMLSEQTMKDSGKSFARAVYKKAEREAYAEAKDRATRTAVKLATEAAQKRIDQDIEHQVKDYTEALAHREELEKMALEDAVNSTRDLKESLQAKAVKEAMQKAVEKVKTEAPLEAQRRADAKAKKAAEDQATKLATEEAREEAQEGLEKKAVIKAREEAQDLNWRDDWAPDDWGEVMGWGSKIGRRSAQFDILEEGK
ncbi:unnamed protein product [Durusdinium trenchii]|uniref:nicotinamidase n=1 Tax=Durusdinium trenchii TaxID=1381693 RepID=A0ABP0H9B0_9DINO